MSVEEAANILGITPERVRKLCQQGRFGTKFSGVWLITREEIAEYQRTRRRPGRPRKSESQD